MSDQAIDEVILSLLPVDGRWKKVAMVVMKVADAMGNDLPDGDDGYQLVARRIEGLVSDGRLAAQGDIKNWRFSEIRRPD